MPVCQSITAIAHLRAGEYPIAIRLLENAGGDGRWPFDEIVCPPLAMAHNRASNQDGAFAVLALSRLALESATQKLVCQPQAVPRTCRFDFVESLALNRVSAKPLVVTLPNKWSN